MRFLSAVCISLLASSAWAQQPATTPVTLSPEVYNAIVQYLKNVQCANPLQLLGAMVAQQQESEKAHQAAKK